MTNYHQFTPSLREHKWLPENWTLNKLNYSYKRLIPSTRIRVVTIFYLNSTRQLNTRCVRNSSVAKRDVINQHVIPTKNCYMYLYLYGTLTPNRLWRHQYLIPAFCVSPLSLQRPAGYPSFLRDVILDEAAGREENRFSISLSLISPVWKWNERFSWHQGEWLGAIYYQQQDIMLDKYTFINSDSIHYVPIRLFS